MFQKAAFSTDGGHTWGEPQVFHDDAWKPFECGYTSTRAVGDDSFLVAYSDDFGKLGGQTEEHKQILVRKITVEVE